MKNSHPETVSMFLAKFSEFPKFRFTFRIKNLESKTIYPNFFSLENHNSMQVQMIHVLFILIYWVLAAVKQFKVDKFAVFTSQFTFRVLKRRN